jgi:hypothetical protein
LRHKFVDPTFVKVLLVLFFQEKKRSLRRSLKVLVLVFSVFETRPKLVFVYFPTARRRNLISAKWRPGV